LSYHRTRVTVTGCQASRPSKPGGLGPRVEAIGMALGLARFCRSAYFGSVTVPARVGASPNAAESPWHRPTVSDASGRERRERNARKNEERTMRVGLASTVSRLTARRALGAALLDVSKSGVNLDRLDLSVTSAWTLQQPPLKEEFDS